MEDNHEDTVDVPEANSLGLGWRIGVGLLAIIIIGFLVFPFIRAQLTTEAGDSTLTSPLDQPTGSDSGTGLEADSNSAKAQFDLGNSYYEAGNWEQAVKAYKRAIELEPSYQAAYANLGVTYYQQQKFDLAASQYQKALELEPKDGDVAYNLGALYLQQALSHEGGPDAEEVNQAIDQLEKAMEISPDLAEPYFSLGVAYMALDQREKAIESFETYLSRDPDKTSQANKEAQLYLKTLRAQ